MSPQLSVSTTKHSAFWNRLSSHSLSSRSLSYVTIASSILFLLALVFVPELLSSRSFADEPITVNPSITIGNSGLLSLSVNPGQFASTSQDVVVTTSNYTGYTMTIAPSSGSNTDLEHTAVSNVTIPTITPTAPATSITSSDFSNLNTAAYGLSIDDGTNYLPVVSGSTIKSTSTATNATTGSFSLTLGAKTLTDTPAGSYTKTFLLTATTNDAAYNITYDKNLNGDTDTTGNFPSANEATVSGTVLTLSPKTPTRTGYRFLGWSENANATTATYPVQGTMNLEPTTANPITLYAIWGCGDGYICYYENGADGGQGTMKQTTFQSSAYNANSSQTLIAPNYSKTGYGFVGWSETQVDLTQSDTNLKAEIANLASQGKVYGPNQTITMPSSGPLELYAVWQPAEKDGNNNPVYLQGWNGCSSLDPNEVVVLTDNRDDSVYAIARIVDDETNPTYSQCWMIENLRLDVANQNITYTNNNTNHPASSFLYQIDAFTSGDPTWQTCTDSSITCTDQISYSLANINRNNDASYNASNQTSSWFSYGVLYNWFTATAGNGLYGRKSGSAAGDICPNGWHLPTGGRDDVTDYLSLDAAITNSGFRDFPSNYVLSGYISYYRGSWGEYWSSTNTNNPTDSAFKLDISTSDSNSLYGVPKRNGLALRCLAGNPNYYIIYDANGGTGYGDPQSLGSTAPDGTTTTTLTASNFSRTGYGFAGWSRNPNADPNGVNATTEIYGPNAEFTVPDSTNFDSNKELKLYAIWVPLAKDNNGNDLTFQTTNLLTVTLSDNSTLDSKANGYVTALKDTRDNEVYAVAKLADGNYWMIENMRLDLSSNNTTITTSNTNHPTAAFIDDIDNNYKNNSSATLWRGCSDNTPDCINRVSFNTNNLTRLTTASIYDSQKYGWYSYGIYYNWYTATGGNGIYNLTTGRTDGDLCPAGWHLPTGSGSNSEFSVLKGFTNSTGEAGLSTSDKFRAYPYNFIMSGFITASSAVERGSQGEYWSSSAYDGSGISAYYHSAYYSWISRTTVATGNNGAPKWYGSSIRCLANVSESFSLAYNANGGTGAPAADPGGSSNTRSYDFTLSSTEPTRSGLQFAGWATEQNATEESTLYQAGGTFTAYQPGTTTLYAVWVPEVIIHFDASGGTGYMADQGVPSGTSRTLRSNTFSKSGYGFSGWTTTEGSTNVEYLNQASYIAPVVTGPDPLEVTLYAVWGRSRSIMYNINTDDTNANGTMGDQTSSIYEYGQAELWASNFARPNYGFAGWSTDPDAYTHMTDNDGTNDPTIYGPNETITVPGFGEGSSTLTLYAVWVPAESGIDMQTFSPSDSTYSSKPIGSVIALSDNRDTTNVYAVAKLADGNWWMIENLRLDPAGKTLDNTNTNNPDSSFATTVSGLQSSSFNTCTASSSVCDDQYSVGLGNITASDSNKNRTGSGQSYRWYSYGAMYNWYTATAGHGTYSKTSSDGAMPGDICPAGWHLPYGGDGTGTKGGNTSGGFYYLNYILNNNSNGTDATASSNLRAYPNNFLYSGYYSGSSSNNRGGIGLYWSSTACGIGSACDLYINNLRVDPSVGYSSEYNGFSVRCVASPRQTLTLSFDTTKVASIEIDGTSYSTNGTTISLIEGSTHTINMTFQSGYEFDSWSVSGTGTSVASTSTQSTTLTIGTTNSTLTAKGKASTATCTKQYRLQNADGTYPSSYTADGTEQVAIGSTCTYSKTVTDYNSNTAKSTSGTMTASGITLSLDLPRNTYTCSQRYRLQNADGSYPSSYTADGSQALRWGQTCSYNKSVTDYQTKSTSTTMGKANSTVSLDLPRNTYTLTVNRNTTYISSVTGAGTYRWGQSVSISATASSGNEFTAWSQTAGTTGTFGSTTSRSTTFTMGKGAATIYANGKASIVTFDQAYAAAGESQQDGYYEMQEMTPDICNAVTVGQTGELVDARDGEVYSVAKFGEGQCWMTRNLRFIPFDNYEAYELRDYLTNNATEAFAREAVDESPEYFDWSNPTYGDPSTYDRVLYYTGYLGDYTTDSTGHTRDDYGVYYNWYTATAGNGTYGMQSTYDPVTTRATAAGDICPRGWHLPTGDHQFMQQEEDSDLKSLINAINSGSTNTDAGLIASPADFVYSGMISNPQQVWNSEIGDYVFMPVVYSEGSDGYIWSATTDQGGEAPYTLHYNSSHIYGDGVLSHFGVPVRCLAYSE